jgi:hypothetical protein
MKRGITGDYRITTVGGETVRAFIPYPLPPEPPLAFTNYVSFYNRYLAILSEGAEPL